MGLPRDFGSSSGQRLDSLVLERLQLLYPETEAHEAVLCLEEASLALCLSRSYQGIVSSSSKDLVPLFEMSLRGPLPEKEEGMLEEYLRVAKESPSDDQGLQRKADKVKGAFHLLRAATIRRRSPSPTTA